MNRGLLIIVVPAMLVALLYLAVGWGYAVSAMAAAGGLVLVAAVLLWRHKRHAENSPRGTP